MIKCQWLRKIGLGKDSDFGGIVSGYRLPFSRA
jgi:hypothetical protein